MFKIKCVNTTKCKIETDNVPLFDLIRTQFSIPNEAARFSQFSPDILNVISLSGYFNIGLTNDILDIVKRYFPNELIELQPEVKSYLEPLGITSAILPVPNINYVYRDYQLEAIQKSLLYGRGINLLPTAAGKTLIIGGIIYNLLEKCKGIKNILVIFPNLQLVRQTYADCIEFGINENLLQMFSSFSSELNSNKVIFANMQWLNNHNKELPEISVIIMDECHRICAVQGNVITKYIKKISTPIKIGLTATLPDDKMGDWSCRGLIGPILISKKITELQDLGFLSKIKVLPIKFNHANKPPYKKLKTLEEFKNLHREEYQFIEQSEVSNKMIISIAKKLSGNTLILFDHTIHGKLLFELLDIEKKYFINGETEIDIRENIRNAMEETSDNIIVAQSICFSTGISIKNLNNIIFAFSGKAKTKILQSAGRSMRLHKDKEYALIIDIFHNFKYSEKHFLERLKLYDEYYGKKDLNIKSLSI